MRGLAALILFLGVAFFAAPSRAQTAVDPNLGARLAPEAAFPGLEAEALSDKIPLTGIDPFAADDTLHLGDSITVLITLHEKKNRRTQWILYLKIIPAPASAHDAEEKPTVFYTSTGHRYEFAPASAQVRVQTIGPCPEPEAGRAPPAVKAERAEISVNKGFLGLGFDRGAAFFLRPDIQQKFAERRLHKGANGDFNFGMSDHPFDRATVLVESNKAARLRVTESEERSVVGWVPATVSYFETTMDCPDLQSILLKVIKMPSVWSLLKDRGVTAFIGFESEGVTPFPLAGWGMPPATAGYALPWTGFLNDQPALKVTMVVTAARPPLLACAGIVGMLAENPDNPAKYLTLRVISARQGPINATKK